MEYGGSGTLPVPIDANPHAECHVMTKIEKILGLKFSLLNLYLRLNTRIWQRLPSDLRNTELMRLYGKFLHQIICQRADRRQFTNTFFFRNRPELELMCRLTREKTEGATLDIAVLGCSIGAEVYSISMTIRKLRPDLNVHIFAIDNSAEVLKVAKDAVYTSQSISLAGSSMFERITEAVFVEMFEGDRHEAKVRPWIREGTSWHLGDASDPELVRAFGSQDMVVASNFLCHMKPSEAEYCLRNIARLVKSGGYLFVTGIDLDVREKVARELRWRPVSELIEEIHEGDPSVRGDWPCAWWGLEPLDKKRVDWQLRYAVVFQLNEDD